ncbi:MAG TPA: tail fiber domain-containing protein [Bacteroidales bacterium]|nr:tail fiber domain-containing protein [Bacteroidales bacterium]
MKSPITKIIFSLFFLMIMGYSFAQAPQAFNYQAVARDVAGNVIPNQALGIKISIHLGSATGSVSYSETFAPTTNDFGLFTLAIGTGTIVDGQFDTIAWGKNQYWMQVEMDPSGGATYTDMGTTQLLSVPYALFAERTKALPLGSLGQTLRHDGMGWLSDTSIFNDGTHVGIGVSVPTYKLDVWHPGSTGVRVKSRNSFSVVDIDAKSGDAALRFAKDGINQWNIRNQPATNSLEFFEFGGGGTRLIISDSLGYVGIGTTTPTNIFEVINGGTGSKFRVGNLVGFGLGFGQDYNTSNASYFLANGGSYWHFCFADTPDSSYVRKVTLDGGGNIFRPYSNNVMSLGSSTYKWTAVYAVNGTIQTSDLRYKTNINDIQYGLNEVLKLRPVSYNWKNEKLNIGTGKNLGFIAQEMENIVPDVVVHTQTEIDKETNQPGSEFPDAYSVKYSELIPVLVKAIQEQQAQIEQLKQEIELLKEK